MQRGRRIWPEMKCQALTSQMIVGPSISFCALGTQLPEVSLVVEAFVKDTFQLVGIMDISQMVGIVDLVDGQAYSNEHLILTKVKCLLPHSSLFLGTHLNHPHFFPTPQNQGER
jgi:hypothetical protein